MSDSQGEIQSKEPETPEIRIGKQLHSLCEDVFGDVSTFTDELLKAEKDQYGTWTIRIIHGSREHTETDILTTLKLFTSNRIQVEEQYYKSFELKGFDDESMAKANLGRPIKDLNKAHEVDGNSILAFRASERVIERMQNVLVKKVAQKDTELVSRNNTGGETLKYFREACDLYPDSMHGATALLGTNLEGSSVRSLLQSAGFGRLRILAVKLPLVKNLGNGFSVEGQQGFARKRYLLKYKKPR